MDVALNRGPQQSLVSTFCGPDKREAWMLGLGTREEQGGSVQDPPQTKLYLAPSLRPLAYLMALAMGQPGFEGLTRLLAAMPSGLGSCPVLVVPESRDSQQWPRVSRFRLSSNDSFSWQSERGTRYPLCSAGHPNSAFHSSSPEA